jgi:hypothetical protein
MSPDHDERGLPGRGRDSSNTQPESTSALAEVDVLTGEIVEPTDLGADAARELTDRIRTTVNKVTDIGDKVAVLDAQVEAIHDKRGDLWHRAHNLRREALDLMGRAYAGRVWLALGCTSWENYCDRELADLRTIRLIPGERVGMVEQLHGAGMSTRAIASGLGIAQSTVSRQVRQIAAWSGESSDSPAPVIGQDGKAYPRERKPLPPPPERRTDDDDGTSYLRSLVLVIARECLTSLRDENAVNQLGHDVGEARKADDTRWLTKASDDLADLARYVERLLAVVRDPVATERARTDPRERDDLGAHFGAGA